MKKEISRILLLLLPILFIGCKSGTILNNNNYIFGQDEQYYFFKPNVYILTLAESEDGYYFFSGPNQSYLYFMDKKNLKPVILCNKPNCLSIEETDGSKITDCNAFFGGNNLDLEYYNGKLYVLGSDLRDTSIVFSLYAVSLDGTRRTKIIEFKDMIQQLIIHRGYIYYYANDNGTISGSEDKTESEYKICRIDLNNVKCEPETIFAGKGIYGNIGKLTGYGNGVYFHVYQYTDPKLESLSSSLYKYSLSDKSASIIVDNDVGFFTFYQDLILFSNIERKIITCDLNGKSGHVIDGLVGVPLGADNDYIYVTDSDKNGSKFSIHDWQGNTIYDFGYQDVGYVFYGGNDEYFFISDDGSKSNQYGSIYAIYGIEKNKIRKGNASMKKLYEFIPKAKFPGVITREN